MRTTSSGLPRSTRQPRAALIRPPTSRSISGEVSAYVLSARRAVTRKLRGSRPSRPARTASASASMLRLTRRAREKLATPNTRPRRSRTVSHAASGPGVTSMRPMRARTRVPSRSPSAARRFATSRSTNQGRFFPFRAISW